jgi:hypothetical protein
MATAPFDGEGSPQRNTLLVEDGRLQGFLYDTYHAKIYLLFKLLKVSWNVLAKEKHYESDY